MRYSGSQDEALRGQSFDRVLVVGLTPDINLRCDFESYLVTQLRAVATNAVSSCNSMPMREALSPESVARAAQASETDAVLTTSLVAAQVGTKDGGSGDTRGAGYYKATDIGYESMYYGGFGYYGGYGAFGVPVVYAEFETAPAITTVQGNVTVVSRLYATAGATEVYEVVTSGHDLRSRDTALAALTQPIAAQLAKAGLFR